LALDGAGLAWEYVQKTHGVLPSLEFHHPSILKTSIVFFPGSITIEKKHMEVS
jgi:hypothetical protein